MVRLQRVALALVLHPGERVLLMWRHRFATDEWGWELPGGSVDAGEDGAAMAAHEVEEKTGSRPGPLLPATVSQTSTQRPGSVPFDQAMDFQRLDHACRGWLTQTDAAAQLGDA